jgi:3-oxoadipate CoA-transferase alpha subunit
LIDKRFPTPKAAVAGIPDGASVAIGGFGESGTPLALIEALIASDVRDLTVISNNAGSGLTGLAALLDSGKVRKLICSYPRSRGSVVFERLYAAGEIELEVVPQGTLSERLRAAGAGIPAFYTPTGASTLLAADKTIGIFDGRPCVLETALVPDVTLISAALADRHGNLTYHSAARNFGPVMAMAARVTIVQVKAFVELGALDPEIIITPGIFVDRVVCAP